jgi:hypothetical protein
MTMTDEVTVDTIKAMALTANPMTQLEMITEGAPPVAHLVLAAQLYQNARDVRTYAKVLHRLSDDPEHREYVKAMLDAYKGAKVAFEAAAAAVYQLYWVAQHCDCEDCVNDRRREAAPNN